MDPTQILQFISERQSALFLRTGEHLMLAGLSTVIATVIGVGLGIWGFQNRKVRNPLLGLVGILQTVPSLAMLVFLMAIYHAIGIAPALTALTLYALLPIVRNTITGLEGVNPAIMEAARGIGMTPYQQMVKVRLPLAAPVIIAGIRTAAVVGVGVATLAAFIGAGGLGEFINRGLALSNTKLILLGAIPAAILALVVDLSLAVVEWGLKPIKSNHAIKSRAVLVGVKRFATAVPAILIVLSSAVYLSGHPLTSSDGKIAIGSKHFSEHILLGEMMAQVIEAKTDLSVERRFDFPGTMFCHQALLDGALDAYPEYTGTALCAVLQEDMVNDPLAAFDKVRDVYHEKFKLKWLPPFGFNNTWVMVVRKAEAERNGWKTISDVVPLASTLTAGLSAEFAERPDGFKGMKSTYPLKFRSVQDMDANLVYHAVADGEVDIANANETDGRIDALNLVRLEDDKHFFPPYEAAPIIREDTLKKHPELLPALQTLADVLDDHRMTVLNYEVDGKKRSPKSVVKEFLEESGITGNKPGRLAKKKKPSAGLASTRSAHAY